MTSLYESPDGKDCLKKTTEGAVFAGKWGLVWSVADMIARTKPTTAVGVARCAAYWIVPAAGVGATFHATSCLLGELRGKDQALNHMIAGVVSMSVLGARYGPKFAFYASFPVALLAGVCKQVKKDGFDIIPEPGKFHKQYGQYNHYQRRWGPRKEVDEPTNY